MSIVLNKISKKWHTLTHGISSGVSRMKRSFKRVKQQPLLSEISPLEKQVRVQKIFDEALSQENDNQFSKDCDRDREVLSYNGTRTLYEQYKKEFDALYQNADSSNYPEQEAELKEKIEKEFRVFLTQKLGKDQENLIQQILYWFGQSVFNSVIFRIPSYTDSIYGGMFIANQGTKSHRRSQLDIPQDPSKNPVSIRSNMAIAYSQFIPREGRNLQELDRPIQCNLDATHKILKDKVEVTVDYHFSPVPSLENLDVHFERPIPSLRPRNANEANPKLRSFLEDKLSEDQKRRIPEIMGLSSPKAFDSLTQALDRYTLRKHGICFKEPFGVIEKQDLEIPEDPTKPVRIRIEKTVNYDTFEFRGLLHKMKTPIQCRINALYELGATTQGTAQFSLKSIEPVFEGLNTKFSKNLPKGTFSHQMFPQMEKQLNKYMGEQYGICLGAPVEVIEEEPKKHPLHTDRTVLEKVAVYKSFEFNGSSYDLKRPLHVKMYAEIQNEKAFGPVTFSVIEI